MAFPSILILQVLFWYHFLFIRKTSFNNCFKVSSLAINFLHFHWESTYFIFIPEENFALENIEPIPLASVMSDKKQHLNYFSPIVNALFFLSTLNIFSLSLIFRRLIIICLCMNFLVFILCGVYWTFKICEFLIFTKSRTFQLLFLQIFFLHDPFFFPFGTPVTQILDLLVLSHTSFFLSSLFCYWGNPGRF